MRKLSIAVVVAGLALTGLSGCGDDTPESATQPAPSASRQSDYAAKEQTVENMIADCMKKRGFQYVPRPQTEDRNSGAEYGGVSSVVLPPDEVRQFRQKYGFGIYASLVYPNDPAVARPGTNAGNDPNVAIREGLDPARRAAYDEALHGDNPKAGAKKSSGKPQGCLNEAAMAVFGSADQSPDRQAATRKAFEQFQHDPAVVKAAQKYATCLRSRGYQVPSAEPGRIEGAVAMQFAGALPPGGPDSVAPGEAKKKLADEIKAALADLDCRADYAEIARTRYSKVILEGNGAG